jgi:hypothetical protein
VAVLLIVGDTVNVGVTLALTLFVLDTVAADVTELVTVALTLLLFVTVAADVTEFVTVGVKLLLFDTVASTVAVLLIVGDTVTVAVSDEVAVGVDASELLCDILFVTVALTELLLLMVGDTLTLLVTVAVTLFELLIVGDTVSLAVALTLTCSRRGAASKRGVADTDACPITQQFMNIRTLAHTSANEGARIRVSGLHLDVGWQVIRCPAHHTQSVLS